MKIRTFLFLVASFLIFGNLYSQIVTISGETTSVPNPCHTEPCVPGLVYAIETDSINYIITLQGYWKWPDGPLVIETYSFDIGDPITVEGVVSVKQDIWGKDYTEIEVLSVIPVSIDDITSRSDISVFPNPSKGSINIESQNKQIKNIEIIDLNGEKLLECKYLEHPYSIRIENINRQGVLMLRILFIDNSQVIKKIVVL
ncbi:MAG: T9SS type A sorting domain-containing protein [Bacteroidales bacterium]|nr:T9SS type A sorting domain-containing protein [Bacteroidales bacterium]